MGLHISKKHILAGVLWGAVSLLVYSYILGQGLTIYPHYSARSEALMMSTAFIPATASVAILQVIDKVVPTTFSGALSSLMFIIPPIAGVLFFIIFLKVIGLQRRQP